MKPRDFRKVLEKIVKEMIAENQQRHNDLMAILNEIKIILNKEKPK